MRLRLCLAFWVCLVSPATVGCSSTSSGSSGSGGDASTPPSGNPDCATWGGTCAKGSSQNPVPSCPSGLAPVRGATAGLCSGSLDVCCVSGSAGSRIVKGTAGLLCTAKSFSEFEHGTCGGASCAVGGECRNDGAGATCDVSRGLPPTKEGSIECAVFGCGSITCALGCSCKDPVSSTCSCP